MNAIWMRIAAMAGVGAALLFVSYFPPQAKKTWWRAWAFPIAGLFGWLLLALAAAIAGGRGGAAAAVMIDPLGGKLVLQTGGAMGAVAGLYVASIGTQFIGNAARYLLRQPARKIEWVRRWPPKRRANARQ